MGFTLSKVDSDVWMRRSRDLYEYIAVYTDDLLIGSKDPKKITDTLENVHGFKL